MNTTEQLASVLDRACPDLSGDESTLRGFAREARRQLRRWGHGGHDVALARVDRRPGGSGILGCVLWCESCHVS